MSDKYTKISESTFQVSKTEVITIDATALKVSLDEKTKTRDVLVANKAHELASATDQINKAYDSRIATFEADMADLQATLDSAATVGVVPVDATVDVIEPEPVTIDPAPVDTTAEVIN